MTRRPPLTRSIGTAERHLQALLRSRLAGAGLAFPDWVVLTHLHTGQGVPEVSLTAALTAGKVVEAAAVGARVQGLAGRRLIARGEAGWRLTEAGRATFLPLRAAVAGLTEELESGIPEADIATTHRVLTLLAERAAARA